jgi:hydroxyacylglutathione hydrolase
MFIKPLYTNSLSEAAYFIESEGEAAVIDPLRDIEEYLLLAQERNATIKYIFETHFQADFVSGHIDLSKTTGAPIIYGPGAEVRLEAVIAEDGQQFNLGKLTLTVLHTPGHTVASTCYLLKNENRDYAVFTGDTLFVGDVGRPDLNSGDMNKEEMAGRLYESLQTKILSLADDTIIYPGYGPGTSFGKSIGTETQSTIGEQKRTNSALQHTSKDAFVAEVVGGLSTSPTDFPINASTNNEGGESIDALLNNGLRALSVPEFRQFLENDAVILDTRNASVFSQGFVPGSIFIGLEGKFAEWAGTLLPFDKTIILVTEEGMEKETITRLARLGFSKIEGFLQGGFEAWKKAGEKTDLIIEVEADELAMDIPFDENLIVVDVRKEVEFADGHVKDAVNIPLGNMVDPASMADIEDKDNLYLQCSTGFRSTIAASLLKRQGIHNLRNVTGGWEKIKDEPRIKTEKDATVLN